MYPKTSEEVVQGEKLQALASISLVTPGHLDYIRRYKDTTRIRCLVLPGAHDDFYEITDADVALLARGDCPTLFVFGNTFRSFTRVIAPRLRHPYTLIVHNSDENVDERYRDYLDSDPNLVRCFCQNQVLDHPKLVVLPIGVANWQWAHGNADVVARTWQGPNPIKHPRDQACYVYFNEATNRARRAPAWAPAQHFGRAPGLHYEAYLPFLSRFFFAIAPEGNGADTHRFWEALYAGTIPVVLNSPHIAHWQRAGIPMVVVERWEDVTPALLGSQDLPALQERVRNLPQLHLSYWRGHLAQGAASAAPKPPA